MSTDAEYDLPKVLIRAGRRAWELYREGNSSGTVEEDVAVSLLAKHLVVLAKDGITGGAARGRRSSVFDFARAAAINIDIGR